MTTTKALAIVVQEVGIGECAKYMCHRSYGCPDPWFHMATATCSTCECLFEGWHEHAHSCTAIIIARLNATCKVIAEKRRPADVKERVDCYNALQDQFKNVEESQIAPPDFGSASQVYDSD